MKDYERPLPISLWAEDDRPREKLLKKGRSALSDAELIAILLRSGTMSVSAVDIAKNILAASSNSLLNLSKLSVNDLIKFKGIGEAKAISIVAALELGRRRNISETPEVKRITCSNDVFDFIKADLSDLKHEEFWIILLNRANQVIKKIAVSTGGLAATVVDPKRIFNIAVENNTSSIILCHNHPSGIVNPSEQDKKITSKITECGILLEIHVLDHIIVGENSYFSFKDEGLI